MYRSATLSDNHRYRYELFRVWDTTLPTVIWLMLNPSTADTQTDDPTTRRVVSFSQSWGFGGLVVVNLFAMRAIRPSLLRNAVDPVGPDNDATLRRWVRRGGHLVAGWGVVPRCLRGRVTPAAKRMTDDLLCLGRTKEGRPRHPLYVRRDVRPVRLASTNWEQLL